LIKVKRRRRRRKHGSHIGFVTDAIIRRRNRFIFVYGGCRDLH
jgi:hypothetical protein